jgi:hypothetical protein
MGRFRSSLLCDELLYFHFMTGWKKVVLQGAGFGVAFALVVCLILGGWLWYDSLPHAPKWNSTAIRATFKEVGVTTSAPRPKLTFSYVLENTTDADYSIPNDKSTVLVMATLPEGKGLEADEALSLTPCEIPARQKVVFSLSKEAEYTDAYLEADKDNAEKLAPFWSRRLKELDGFVLFDKAHRYEIILPNGWPDVKQQHAK